jgi:hypothetical protein
LVISSNFYISSWDDTLLITLLLVTIRVLVKLTNSNQKYIENHNQEYNEANIQKETDFGGQE